MDWKEIGWNQLTDIIPCPSRPIGGCLQTRYNEQEQLMSSGARSILPGIIGKQVQDLHELVTVNGKNMP